MQERHMNLIDDDSLSSGEKATRIRQETTNIPSDMRTPTEKEIEAIHRFRKDFVGSHPKASDRQIRRAIMKKFNITLLPNTK